MTTRFIRFGPWIFAHIFVFAQEFRPMNKLAYKQIGNKGSVFDLYPIRLRISECNINIFLVHMVGFSLQIK